MVSKEYARLLSIRERNKKIIHEAKSEPCMDCGVQYPAIALDRLLAEIAKCEAVCANCHRIRTHIRRLRLTQSGQSSALGVRLSHVRIM